MNQYRPNDRQIIEQAAEWQLALKSGDAREREAFVKWLLESRRHVRNYLLLAAFEQELRKLDPEHRHDVDQLLADAASDVVSLETKPLAGNSRTRRRWITRGWSAAAIAASISLAAVFVQWIWSLSASSPMYHTGVGEQQTLRLVDGSVVHLNSQSRLRVEFSDTGRRVQLLEGEALFVVERDVKRPFHVIAGAAVVQAIGTQFNVRRTAFDTVVSVVEGRVRIERSDKPLVASAVSTPTNELTAGEEARIDRDGRLEREPATDVRRRIAWRQRVLEFREDTLATIVAEFNRYNLTPQFRLDSDELSERKYTGVFKADDPKSLAELLSQEDDIIVETSGTEIAIRRR